MLKQQQYTHSVYIPKTKKDNIYQKSMCSRSIDRNIPRNKDENHNNRYNTRTQRNRDTSNEFPSTESDSGSTESCHRCASGSSDTNSGWSPACGRPPPCCSCSARTVGSADWSSGRGSTADRCPASARRALRWHLGRVCNRADHMRSYYWCVPYMVVYGVWRYSKGWSSDRVVSRASLNTTPDCIQSFEAKEDVKHHLMETVFVIRVNHQCKTRSGSNGPLQTTKIWMDCNRSDRQKPWLSGCCQIIPWWCFHFNTFQKNSRLTHVWTKLGWNTKETLDGNGVSDVSNEETPTTWKMRKWRIAPRRGYMTGSEQSVRSRIQDRDGDVSHSKQMKKRKIYQPSKKGQYQGTCGADYLPKKVDLAGLYLSKNNDIAIADLYWNYVLYRHNSSK